MALGMLSSCRNEPNGRKVVSTCMKNTNGFFLKPILVLGVFFLVVASHSFSQTDTTWNHKIKEADIVLQVKMTSKQYVTEAGMFACEVLKVVKGTCNARKLSFYLELIESSVTRFQKRFDALMDKETVTISFKKDDSITKNLKIDGVWYAFFMSA